MSSSLTELALFDILPPSIAEDDQLAAIADGLDPESQDIIRDITRFLPYHPNLDNLPSRIVDLLAWQYHVDDYDAEASVEVKRARVRAAIAEHKIHGTRSAVIDALDSVFGEGNYTLLEWWQTVNKQAPYTYRVLIHIPFTAAMVAAARTLLRIVASIRSWWLGYITWDELDALGYTWEELDALSLTWSQMDDFYFHVNVP